MVPKTISDFSVLPIAIPPLPSFPKETTHYLYVRKNMPKIPTQDDSRSLFLLNVPADSTEAHFRSVFSSLVGPGKFESILFESDRRTASSASAIETSQSARLAAQSKKRKRVDAEVEVEALKEERAAQMPDTWSRGLHRSGSTAVALLADDRSVDVVLKAVAKVHKTKKYPLWGDGVGDKVPSLGPTWLASHDQLAYPGNTAMQESVDAFFVVFNRKEQEAAETAKRLRNEPDEDGFVTVTRGGRAAPARRDEAEEARRRMLERQEKKKTELSSFYRFQMRDRQKAEQAELLKRFEEDRQKVNAMKEKRGKFRPET